MPMTQSDSRRAGGILLLRTSTACILALAMAGCISWPPISFDNSRRVGSEYSSGSARSFADHMSQIRPGWTREEVRIHAGPPSRIDDDDNAWVYVWIENAMLGGSGRKCRVYFDGDIVLKVSTSYFYEERQPEWRDPYEPAP